MKKMNCRIPLVLLLSVLCLLLLVACVNEPQPTEPPATDNPGSPGSSTPKIDEGVEPPWSVCSGYVVKTDHDYYFVSDSDQVLFEKDAVARMKTEWSGINIDWVQTGDHVQILIMTVEQPMILETTVFEVKLLESGKQGNIPQSAIEAIQDYEAQVYDAE